MDLKQLEPGFWEAVGSTGNLRLLRLVLWGGDDGGDGSPLEDVAIVRLAEFRAMCAVRTQPLFVEWGWSFHADDTLRQLPLIKATADRQLEQQGQELHQDSRRVELGL